jgi:mono/diheme cytochrome c family protein
MRAKSFAVAIGVAAACSAKSHGILVVARRYREISTMMRVAFFIAAVFALAVPASAQQPTAADGQKVFADKKCSVCHLVGGVGNKKGPVLDGVGAKLTKADIREWITNAPEMAAKAKIDRKPPMKAYDDFTKEEVDALVAYLATLRK